MAEFIVTDTDRQMAQDAMVAGYEACQLNPHGFGYKEKRCACDLGSIVGCRARVEAIAAAIATARKL